MGITSYAQNFEDVILWRALGHVENGTYLDVGAHHPEIDSVSKAFYDRGWRGVHVEPGAIQAQLLRERRPGEIVVQAMVSDQRGIRTFYETPGGGLSTADKEVAEFHRKNGYASVSATTVVSITLDDVLEQVPGDEIHWLKIDVEGFERQVLLSWQTSARRPWIVVVEATWPKTQIPTHDQWEDFILSKGYELAYNDGLNRYYLSERHGELREHLRYPPNVFDEFQIDPGGSSVFSQDMKAFLEHEISVRAEHAAELERELARARSEFERVESDLAVQKILYEHAKVDREADFANHKRIVADHGKRLERLTEELGRMVRELDRFAVGVACDRTLPWPLRALARPTVGEGAMALGRLLSLPDDAFLRASYDIILGREPDAMGMAHYRRKMMQGHGRSWVLADLTRSEEARRRANGADLAELPDDAFIDAAYLRELGRPSDPDGKEHYLAMLEAGQPRAELLRTLRDSAEGRQRQAGIRHEIDDLRRRVNSLFHWRTWFHPVPKLPSERIFRQELSEASEGWSWASDSPQAASIDCTALPKPGQEEVRRMQDKVALLAAAVEAINTRH